MIKVATSEQMREIDRYAIEVLGIPGIVLMENAALSVVNQITALGSFKSAVVFAGSGNNGGDGFAIARHLFNKGYDIKVFVLSNMSAIKGDARTNLDILFKMGVYVMEVSQKENLKFAEKSVKDCDVIIDAIFGTGFKGEVRGIARDIIDIINSTKKYVVSVDVPSGVEADTGRIYGPCVKADLTITFQLPKIGLVIHPGADMTGELIIKDIGIPQQAINSQDIRVVISDNEMASRCFQKRSRDTHKGTYGKALIIAGSRGMTGAAVMAAVSCLRTGTGLVYLAVPDDVLDSVSGTALEVVKVGYKRFEDLHDYIEGCDVIALGPGMGHSELAASVISRVVEASRKPMVLDADALNFLSKNQDLLKFIKSPFIITPHPGEMARLINSTIERVQSERIYVASEFASKYNAITVLKGSRTIIASDRGVVINTTGNPGMATAGSGDVLTGIIAGLLAQGCEPVLAATSGVYLHGMAGDIAKEKNGEYGMIAGDIIKYMPEAIKMLQENKIE